MPYSGLESLAAQTPVIGANIGGIPELVWKAKLASNSKAGIQDDLARTLTKAAQVDAGRYASMQESCGRYVEERCRQDMYVRQLEDVYRGTRNADGMSVVSGVAGNR